MDLKGVNLGGWLLLEEWITPSLFEGKEAKDEFSLCKLDADNQYASLKSHRDNFITKEDFSWLAANGFRAVRIPIGYWALNDSPPYLNCQDTLDQAFDWAESENLSVVLDLHGAPGSQNGLDHSGKIGQVDWTLATNIEKTMDILKKLAERYGKHQYLWGISLLNEPDINISRSSLEDFYHQAYTAVRAICGSKLAIIICDSFQPTAWNGFMSEPDYENVVLDMHLYQCFSKQDKALDIQGHLDKTSEWAKLISQSDKPVIVGEWSLGLDPKTFEGMGSNEEYEALKSYADYQYKAFNETAGNFFWTYKTENAASWNLRYLVDKGIII